MSHLQPIVSSMGDLLLIRPELTRRRTDCREGMRGGFAGGLGLREMDGWGRFQATGV